VAVKIKLKRMGKMRNAQYRIVVADARTKRDGRAIEEIGTYQPKQDPSLIVVDSERAQYWLGVGAQPTEAVAAILRVTGDWQRFTGAEGAEGSLQVAAPKPDKVAVFEAAAKETFVEAKPAARAKPKAEPVAEPADAAAQAPSEETPTAEVAEATQVEVAAEDGPAEAGTEPATSEDETAAAGQADQPEA